MGVGIGRRGGLWGREEGRGVCEVGIGNRRGGGVIRRG